MMQYPHQMWSNKPFIIMAASPSNQNRKHDVMKSDILPTVLMIQVFVGMVHCVELYTVTDILAAYTVSIFGVRQTKKSILLISHAWFVEMTWYYTTTVTDTATKINVSNNSFLLFVAACYKGVQCGTLPLQLGYNFMNTSFWTRS